MVSYIIIALLFACLPLWLWHLFAWRKMLLGLLLYMPFAGMVTLFFGGQDILKLAKDLLFVLPAYFSFLLMGIRSLPQSRVPTALVAAMIAFSVIVLLQMARGTKR